jgi:transketolase
MAVMNNPLNIKNKLVKVENNRPLYSVAIKNRSGSEVECADPRAIRALLLLMNQHAVIGGAACHWGGPSAMAETMSALHQIMFDKPDWFENFNFVNDIGHAENGIYALRSLYQYGGLSFDDLKAFRSINSNLTGHGESHLYPEGVLLSNGPLGSALPQAQGLAMADKLAGKNRTTIAVVSDGASMEGEAKEAFSAISGLANKNKLNPFVLIISDNNTKLSGRIDADSFSMQPSFDAFKLLGYHVITVTDGHNLELIHHKLEEAIEWAQNNVNKPVCLLVKTIKGKGLKQTEVSSSGGHGYPLKAYDENLLSCLAELYPQDLPPLFSGWAQEILNSKPSNQPVSVSEVKSEKVQVGIANAMIKAFEEGAPIVSISSDLAGSTGVASFQKKFPQASFDVGIAESNMLSVATGMAKMGYIPVVDTFAAFGVTKGNLPLIMANLSQAPIIAIFSHTGFQDAADGASHQSTTYISSVAAIPHTDIYLPSCSLEADFLLTKVIEDYQNKIKLGQTPNSSIFFIGRENFPQHFGHTNFELNKPIVIKAGKDGLILSTGPMLDEAIKASELLKAKGIDITVAHLSLVNHFDLASMIELVKANNHKLLTIEDHQRIGGMGQIVSSRLLAAGLSFKYCSIANDGKFGRSAYSAFELYQAYNMAAEDIVAANFFN